MENIIELIQKAENEALFDYNDQNISTPETNKAFHCGFVEALEWFATEILINKNEFKYIEQLINKCLSEYK